MHAHNLIDFEGPNLAIESPTFPIRPSDGIRVGMMMRCYHRNGRGQLAGSNQEDLENVGLVAQALTSV